MSARQVLLAVAVFGAVACVPRATSLPPTAESSLHMLPVPDFSRRTLTGEQLDTATTRGEVVVVKFFAKYCKPCAKTLPAAEKLHQKYPDVVMIGVAEDEYRADAEAMVATHGLTFPVVHDAAHSLSGRYRVTVMPATFVADRQGKVRWIGGPGQDHTALAQAVSYLRDE